MKPSSLSQYLELIGKAINDQQLFNKKLLSTLQLLKPQSKEFSKQIVTLNQEYEKESSNQNFEPSEEIAKYDLSHRQIQKDIESINVQLRILKSANATSRKGQGAPDLTAIEKSKKLKQSLKEYQNESTQEIYEIKSSLAKNSNELKNSGETITSMQANLQATRDELSTLKARVQTKEYENIGTRVKEMQEEIEALKSLTEVIHKGLVSKENLIKMKQSNERTVNILKNEIQNLKNEVKSIKLLKQGKMPDNLYALIDSVNSFQDELHNVKNDLADKSTFITSNQEELSNIRSDVDKLKYSQVENNNSELAERINQIEEKLDTISGRSLQNDQILTDQKVCVKNIKDEILPNLENRVAQVENQVSEMSIAENSTTSIGNSKDKSIEEYQNLSQKVEQMINEIQSSNITKRAISKRNSKPNVSRTVDTLRSFQKALLAQEKAEQESVYHSIDPSHLPLVVQSIDQLLSEVYSEMYKIRDHLSNEISFLKKNSIPLKVDDLLKKED